MLENDVETHADLLPPSMIQHDFCHVPKGYQVRKGAVAASGQVLPGWAVIRLRGDPPTILGWNFRSRREAVAFASGCEAGQSFMASFF